MGLMLCNWGDHCQLGSASEGCQAGGTWRHSLALGEQKDTEAFRRYLPNDGGVWLTPLQLPTPQPSRDRRAMPPTPPHCLEEISAAIEATFYPVVMNYPFVLAGGDTWLRSSPSYSP